MNQLLGYKPRSLSSLPLADVFCHVFVHSSASTFGVAANAKPGELLLMLDTDNRLLRDMGILGTSVGRVAD